jgi:hypothetical protein
MKRELLWRGANSISKFDHHNINAPLSTIHDVTGRTCKLNLLMRYLWAERNVLKKDKKCDDSSLFESYTVFKHLFMFNNVD